MLYLCSVALFSLSFFFPVYDINNVFAGLNEY